MHRLLVYPSGEEKTVLRVPNYRFDWQVGYELAEPLDLPKGTRFKTGAHLRDPEPSRGAC